MGKSGDTRLDETITFIRNNALLNAGLRTRAADYAEHYLNGNPGQKAAISTSLHIGDSSADPQQYRHNRRAYVLLHKAITADCMAAIGPGLPAANITIAGATARGHLPEMVKWAAILRDHQTLSSYSMNMVLADLQANPLTFLQNNPLIVLGTPTRDPTQGDRNVLLFHLSFSRASTFRRFQFCVGASAGAMPVNVDSVAARWWTDIPGSYVRDGNTALGNFSQLSGIELCSPVMVTTQFTGCAFAMKRHNGHVYCAHTTPRKPIDPNDPAANTGVVRIISGNQLAQDIRQMNGVRGNFTNAAGGPDLAIYGAGWSHGTISNRFYPNGLPGGSDYMTVIGVQRGTDHEIYSQVTQNNQITSAQRIY
jgi:hypothetical protein